MTAPRGPFGVLDDAVASGGSCGTVLHSECRSELSRCPTLGCWPRLNGHQELRALWSLAWPFVLSRGLPVLFALFLLAVLMALVLFVTQSSAFLPNMNSF